MNSYNINEDHLDKPLISFIIASYNVSESLERCLKSIIEQSLENFEVLIINDKSTDNTLEIAQSFAKKDKKNRIKVISHLRNRGLAAVRNTGFLASRGKYIWHIDGDDYLGYKHAVKFISQIFEKENVPVIKVGVFSELNENDFIKAHPENNEELDLSYEISNPSSLLYKNGLGGVFGYIFRKDLGLELGIKNLEGINIGEDQILLSQIYRIVPTIVDIKHKFYVYDKTGASLMRSKWGFERYLEDRVYTYYAMETFGLKSISFGNLATARAWYVMGRMINRSKKDLSESFHNLLTYNYLLDYSIYKKNKNLKNLKPLIIRKYDALLEKYEHLQNFPSFFNDSEILNYFFTDTEFIFHLGVHKTATTYIQNLLNQNKYDLALKGIIVIDSLVFRKFIDNTEIEKSDSNIKGFLIKSILPLLFCKPKKIIISDENLLFPTSLDKQFRKDLHKISACSPEGFDLKLVEKLVKLLPNIKLYLAIRDYKDYLVSLHSERVIWDGYFNIEEGVKDWDFNNSCNWNFLISKIYEITNNNENISFFLTRYEDYKNEPLRFASIIAGVKLKIFQEFDFSNREVIRNKASLETINFMERYRNETKDEEISNKFFKKLLNFNHGFSEYYPDFLRNNPFFEEREINDKKYSKSYELHCEKNKFINIQLEFSKLNSVHSDFSFKSSIHFNNINSNFKQEKLRNYQKRIYSNFLRPKITKNIENNLDYSYSREYSKSQKGISAMLRIRNEEKNIKNVLLGIIDVFDEIILVDNNSIDNTLKIVNNLKDNEEKFLKKIKIYNYPFEIAKCGVENFKTDSKSLHSLAYYYNYSLSKCNYTHVMKWDGDMLLPLFLKNNFKSYLSVLMKNRKPIVGRPRGLTVYKGLDNELYYREDSHEKEIRIFNNTVENYFVKDVLWERLQNDLESDYIESSDNIFIEFKDVSQNEFSHWEEGYLGMGMRKRREIRDYKFILDKTSNIDDFTSSIIKSEGFNTISKEEFFKY